MFRRAHLKLYGLLALLTPLLALGAGKGGGKKDEFIKNAVDQASNQFNSDGFTSKPLILIMALAAMSLLPFVLLMVTSFVKISVVLSIVRNALGTQQIPPTQVITGLAIILTVYIMAPTGIAMYRAAEVDVTKQGSTLFSADTAGKLVDAGRR